jgi:hypothetical protein
MSKTCTLNEEDGSDAKPPGVCLGFNQYIPCARRKGMSKRVKDAPRWLMNSWVGVGGAVQWSFHLGTRSMIYISDRTYC